MDESQSQVNKTSIQAESNYGNETLEHIKNNAPEALFRELISNAYDAGAKNIYSGPLYGDGEVTGLFFIDDGVGLSLKSIGSDHRVDEDLLDINVCAATKRSLTFFIHLISSRAIALTSPPLFCRGRNAVHGKPLSVKG
jgi:hypothetical protein